MRRLQNPGAFLSLGASLPRQWAILAFTVGGAGVVLAALLYALLASAPGRIQLVALSLIGAGGMGNLIDRIRYHGYVTDFLNMGGPAVGRAGQFYG
jgi:signal peptidase II